MLNIFSLANGRLFQEEIESLEELSKFQPIWVDLESPTPEEKRWVKQYYGLQIPEDAMDEDIEESARFYEEDNGELHIRSDFLIADEDEPRTVRVASLPGGEAAVEAARHLFPDLLEDDVLRPFGVDRTIANAVHDLALLIEHVVVLEQPLADGGMHLAALHVGQQIGRQRQQTKNEHLSHQADPIGIGTERHQQQHNPTDQPSSPRLRHG